MKRLVFAGLFLLVSSVSFATDTWISSFTVTADTTKVLCGAPTSIPNKWAFLHSVIVSSPTPGGLTVYNSSGSAINKIADIDTSSKGQYLYDVAITTPNRGMTYSNTSTAAVEILYNCH